MPAKPLPPTDILRHLPSIVDARQRLEIDVHVYCHDVMLAALARLTDTCGTVDPADLSPALVTAMFADAYSIIDQIDLVRQVITASPGEPGPVTANFLKQAADARRIRNEMDHVCQRIPNIAGRTGTSDALFGSISFVRCSGDALAEARVGEEVACEWIVVARGTVPGYRGAATGTFSTHEVDRPISNLRLNAAGTSIRLDRICAQLTDILEGVSESVAASIADRMPDLIAETGATEQALRSPTPVMVGAGCQIRLPFGSVEELPVDGAAPA